MKLRELYGFLNTIAPFDTQASWDNSGFLVGDENADVTGIVTCLDVTAQEIELAKKTGANTIVSHHPVIFRAIKSVKCGNPVFEAVSSGISIISAHTCLDKAKGGVNDILCDTLGMVYEKCGEEIAEGFFNAGTVAGITTPEALAAHISEKLGAAIRYCKGSDTVTKIAVCAGSGGDLFTEAVKVGCDAFITGDASYHEIIDAKATGISMFVAGHFETENMIVRVLKDKISAAFPCVPVYESERTCPIITVK